MATPLHLMATTQQPTSSEPKPDPKPPKPRGRKPGKSSGSGGPKKTPQRGMGVAQLERILSEKDQQQQNQPGHPLTGVPVQAQPNLAHFGIPTHRAQRSSAFRVVAGSVGPTEELPSMPKLLLDQDGYYLDHSFKKKRVIGDELGFIKGRDKSYVDHHQILAPINVSNYYGFDLNMGGASSGYIPGNEAMAIHQKGSVTMEFFPGKSETLYEEEVQGRNSRCSSSSIITMEDLSLRIGCPDSSSSSSPSPSSSSLSSSPSSSNSIDLSLKLSY